MIEPDIFVQEGKKIAIQRSYNKCNNNCTFCYEFIDMTEANSDFSTEAALKRIDSYPKDIDIVMLTTFEPTLRKDFFTILEAIKNKLPKAEIQLLTNGRMLNYDKFVNTMINLQLKNIKIAIPLHGPDAITHDKLTKVEGSFNQTFNGIKKIMQHYPVQLRAVMNKQNYSKLPLLANKINNEIPNIEEISFIHLGFTGKAVENFESLYVSFKQSVPPLLEAITLLPNYVIHLLHFPLCILPKEYWNFARGVSISDENIQFPSACDKCQVKSKCCGIWNFELNKKDIDEISTIH